MARPFGTKKIESPEKLWEYFEAYRVKIKADPFKVKDWVGKDAYEVERLKEKPLTMEGFECYLFEEGIISDLSHYFSNQGGAYSDYLAVCSHIKKTIRADQIGGGMAGLYNASITQRLNGLVEKSEQVIVEQPLFPDLSQEESAKNSKK